MSLKYQVLCESTAIIGVCKQENKTSGEIQESTIEFGKSAAPEPEEEEENFGRIFLGGGGGARMMKSKAAAPTFGLAMKCASRPMRRGMAQSESESESDDDDDEDEEEDKDDSDDEAYLTRGSAP